MALGPGATPALGYLLERDPEYRSLASRESFQATFNDVLEAAPGDFEQFETGILNLLCAAGLPGSEKLDVPRCLKRLDRLTSFVKTETERNLHRYRSDPNYGHSEPMTRMGLLVTLVKRDFGIAYNPAIAADRMAGKPGVLNDSRDIFINGVLDDSRKRRWGTCASIPVVVTAVARRLGYPVRLAVAGRHIFAKWEDSRAYFHIEASNPMGMTVHSDDEYRRKYVSPGEEKSGYFLRSLRAAEEFALYMTIRSECLISLARYEETLIWSARALQFAPDDPRFAETAHYGLEMGLKQRSWNIRPKQKIPGPGDTTPFFVGDLLSEQELCLYSTIVAHYKESLGELEAARDQYEQACCANFHGNNEQRDLQRFLRKYNLPRHKRPLLPPTCCAPRRFKLLCRPDEEAGVLSRMALQFELDGELLKARDALHDLYMFNPCDVNVFQWARDIEGRPRFQSQLKAFINERTTTSGSNVV
jgi:hypothetical protein